MSVMKKLMLCSLAMLMVFGTLFAAGSKESVGDGQVELSITYATGDPLTKEKTHEVVQAFQKAHPEIKIIENLSISQGAYLDSLKTLNAADQFPDVFECRDTPVFVRAEMLAPIDQQLVDLIANPIPIYGTVYTVPYVAQTPNGIIYNKALFEKHGWNQNPKTYAEFIALCETIKASGTAPLVAGISDIWHLGFLFGNSWASYIGVENPNWISDRYEGKVKFTDPAFEKAMTQMVELFTNGYVEGGFMSTKESQCVSVLLAEKAAMYYCGTHVFSQIAEADPDFQIGWFPLPDTDGNIKLIGGSTPNGWAITKKAAADPAKVDAFNKFVTFFLSQQQYAPFCAATGQFPTTKEKMVYDVTGPMAKVLEAYTTYPSTLNWNQGVGANEMPSSFRNWSYKKLQEAMMGRITVKEALKAMDAEWEVQARDFNPTQLVKKAL